MKPEVLLLITGPSLVAVTIVLGAYGIGVSNESRTLRANVVALTVFFTGLIWLAFYYFFGSPFGTSSGPDAFPNILGILVFYLALAPSTLAFLSLMVVIAFSAAVKFLRRKKQPCGNHDAG